ncbi:hypothetical protein EVAR_68552_1 [Eumeta japonica]|uniref:Uncharacterized protein n=1 Tax=Eumeta variegata TaxID=151549 RepID=A0A4C1T6A4_EUMVA|nr:hypothetical protein EVAR_68552_1 [Eumeta japonica]
MLDQSAAAPAPAGGGALRALSLHDALRCQRSRVTFNAPPRCGVRGNLTFILNNLSVDPAVVTTSSWRFPVRSARSIGPLTFFHVGVVMICVFFGFSLAG